MGKYTNILVFTQHYTCIQAPESSTSLHLTSVGTVHLDDYTDESELDDVDGALQETPMDSSRLHIVSADCISTSSSLSSMELEETCASFNTPQTAQRLQLTSVTFPPHNVSPTHFPQQKLLSPTVSPGADTTTSPSVQSDPLHGWVGFKIVGDNIDKTIRPRHQTLEKRTQSLHYFHSFAVKDRVDLSRISDVKPGLSLSSLPLTTLLPTEHDIENLKKNCTVLASRVLVQFIPAFYQFEKSVAKHIPHRYQQEMSSKSDVVSSYLNTHVH